MTLLRAGLLAPHDSAPVAGSDLTAALSGADCAAQDLDGDEALWRVS